MFRAIRRGRLRHELRAVFYRVGNPWEECGDYETCRSVSPRIRRICPFVRNQHVSSSSGTHLLEPPDFFTGRCTPPCTHLVGRVGYSRMRHQAGSTTRSLTRLQLLAKPTQGLHSTYFMFSRFGRSRRQNVVRTTPYHISDI